MNTELKVEELSSNNGNAKVELINSMIQKVQLDNGQYGGWCKTYLRNTFNNIAKEYEGQGHEKLFMEGNNKYNAKKETDKSNAWLHHGGYAFDEISSYSAGNNINTNNKNISNLLKKAKKGDFIQMYWYPGQLTPHTIMLMEDVSEKKDLNWADSNLDGENKIVQVGTSYPWNTKKTFQSVVKYLSNDVCKNTCGATLYRLTDKIRKK
jgi:hypothetical protein